MKYINLFKTHTSYESEVNGGGVDISLPNVSYCEDVKDVHYTPYNLVRFYVGNITGTTPQTVTITRKDKTTSVDIEVSEGNKWYTYALPKDEGLCMIEGDSVKNVVVKADINFIGTINYPIDSFIPSSTIEASFKGSNTSNVTNMAQMFQNCSSLTSLDVSSFDTSNVTNMGMMFDGCSSLTSLDLSNFNTSKVTRMSTMFNGCTSLTSLDLSNFNTSKVTHMYNMFRSCSGLTSLYLSGWDTSNVTDMENMFSGCSKLKTIKMVGCSEATRTKIQNQLTADRITGVTFITE